MKYVDKNNTFQYTFLPNLLGQFRQQVFTNGEITHTSGCALSLTIKTPNLLLGCILTHHLATGTSFMPHFCIFHFRKIITICNNRGGRCEDRDCLGEHEGRRTDSYEWHLVWSDTPISRRSHTASHQGATMATESIAIVLAPFVLHRVIDCLLSVDSRGKWPDSRNDET